jgi:hypothetical protein
VKLKATLASALVFLAASALAQTPSKPGSEVKKLDYFVGAWTLDGTIVPGPWGDGGKFSSSNTTAWMDGNFFLVGHSDFKMPAELGGDGKGTSFMGYDADQNVYTYDAFNSLGRRENSKGTLTGDTWVWTGSANYGGQEIQRKTTMKVVSPNSYTFKLEVSIDGTNWMTFMDVKATKR